MIVESTEDLYFIATFFMFDGALFFVWESIHAMLAKTTSKKTAKKEMYLSGVFVYVCLCVRCC